jgi:hypothetical protein
MPFNTDLPLVIALIAQNENQVLHAASNVLGRALSNSYRHRIIDLCDEDGVRTLLTILKEDNVAFAYGFAGVGSQLQLDNTINLWTAARVPFAALWYDHPCYNYRQHLVDSPYVFHCYHVRDHIEARQKHLPASSSRTILLPVPQELEYAEKPRPMGERSNCILFPKTALSPTRWREDWARHSRELQNVLHSLADQALRDRNLDLADEAKTLFGQQKLPANNLDMFMGVIQEVDAYIRAWRSDRLARALLPHPAQILGRGWEYLYDEPRQAIFVPPVLAAECSFMMWHSKIVVNSNPLWRDGIHERVWGGVTTGALVITDRAVKADDKLGNVPNYIGFEWQDNLEDVIATTLQRAREDDADYLQNANKILAAGTLTNHEAYVRIIAQEAQQIRDRLRT